LRASSGTLRCASVAAAIRLARSPRFAWGPSLRAHAATRSRSTPTRFASGATGEAERGSASVSEWRRPEPGARDDDSTRQIRTKRSGGPLSLLGPLLRRHADRAVEPDHLAIEHL